MDLRYLAGVTSPIVTLGFTAILLVILHLQAVRRGSTLLRNLGGRGWAIAFLVVFAASMFSSILVAALNAPYNVPVDWTPIFIYGPVASTLGAVAFFAAWRELVHDLPKSRSPAPQKG